MEMGAVGDARAQPQENDIMQLARVGDVAGMEKLFESGEYDATYTDEEGITPLHWAAINNQYSMCKFLIDHGAEINRKGGESIATPLQWAAQRCHYYTVNLLLQHGADPLISDAQGYNTLHISTFNGNVLLIVLLLHQGIPVDVLDSYGHTGLMWSAYKGFPQCVDVFLRWGASVHAKDEQGFTALHWALVKGSPACIQKLLEYGSDRFAKTETGKTPALTAKELNTSGAWHRALRECGYDEDAQAIEPHFPGAKYLRQDKKGFVTKFLFLWPFLVVWSLLHLLAGLPILLGIVLTGIIGYALQWCAQQVLDHAPPGMRHFHKTPYLAGIFAASLFFVSWNWLFTVLPHTTYATTPSNPHWWLNIMFVVSVGLCAYFYTTSMVHDPGFVPKMNGIAEQKAVIDELLKLWKFDEYNFCVTCMIRTPLRSKHCKQCQRCVAKHDHHCPWVFNCIGVNNHRHFFLYLINLTIGIISYDWLMYHYLTDFSTDASDSCNILSATLCKVVNADAYSAVLALWATLQLSWVSMLLFVQFVQVSRAMTTFENMYGIQDGSHTSAFTSTGTPLDPAHAALAAPDGSAAPAHGHKHAHRGGFLKQWARLLGVEPFLETVRGRGAATGGAKNARRKKKNPYSRGVIANCRDFWCDPAPVFGRRENGSAVLGGDHINYTAVYESPSLMDMGRGRRRGGYEAVAAEEV
ncbi:palmitoyltransferase AKR1 [Plectosphaerella plurivora]|uniref:Palmitoyltransferase n=1 Tax=Plectosphaerella plurivora TaxID=936078 RepID=A0A9P8VII3_9PEZI|nr:palmitoyltransferase AKR1 [Plectosphaerella plurivora]